MSFSNILTILIAAGILIGGIDKITGNHLRLGDKFEQGFQAMGTLALGMIGISSLTPVISDVLEITIVPIYRLLHLDPGMIGGIIANDMGGHQLCLRLAEDPAVGLFASMIVGALFGPLVVFHIPLALQVLDRSKYQEFAEGLLCGLIATPVGCIAGGLFVGLPVGTLMRNMIPIILISVLLIIGLILSMRRTVQVCLVFGRMIMIISMVGLTASAFLSLTGVELIPGILPVADSLEAVGSIAVVLSGTFVVLQIFMKLAAHPLRLVGRLMKLDEDSVAGLIFSFANCVPVYMMMRKMPKKGVIVNVAFTTVFSATFGDHLGFALGLAPSYAGPMILSKIVAGVVSLVLAMLIFCRGMEAEAINIPERRISHENH